MPDWIVRKLVAPGYDRPHRIPHVGTNARYAGLPKQPTPPLRPTCPAGWPAATGLSTASAASVGPGIDTSWQSPVPRSRHQNGRTSFRGSRPAAMKAMLSCAMQRARGDDPQRHAHASRRSCGEVLAPMLRDEIADASRTFGLLPGRTPATQSGHVEPAIGMHDLACDETGAIRDKKDNDVGNVGGLGHGAEWDKPRLLKQFGLAELIARLGRVGEAGGDRVDANTMRGEGERHGAGETNNARLAGRVVGTQDVAAHRRR